MKIRHGAQKLSAAVFCKNLNQQIFSSAECKKSLCLIFALLNFPSTDYRTIAKENDKFLIYYAGHSVFDKLADKAYWLPVNALADNDTHWIIIDAITSNIRRFVAKHILIVTDSCYSGTFTRRTIIDMHSGKERNRYLHKMLSKASRTLMASGGNEPVSDLGSEGNSVFARAFMMGLKNMERKLFTAEELFYEYIREAVAGNSYQTPEYNVIRNSGHSGGDFPFLRVEQ